MSKVRRSEEEEDDEEAGEEEADKDATPRGVVHVLWNPRHGPEARRQTAEPATAMEEASPGPCSVAAREKDGMHGKSPSPRGRPAPCRDSCSSPRTTAPHQREMHGAMD